MVEVEDGRVRVQVQNVGDARPVEVREPDALGIEALWSIEPRRAVHRNLGPEARVAEVGPITDLAVANAHEIREAVAAHVREEDRLRRVGEGDARSLLLVQPVAHALGRGEAVLAQRAVPDEGLVLGHHEVGQPVPGEIEEANIRVVPRHVRRRRERPEGVPVVFPGSFDDAGQLRVGDDDVQVPVAREIHEAMGAPLGDRRTRRHGPHHAEASAPEVALVRPGARLLGEHARQALAVEIDPLMGGAPDALRKVLEALARQLEQRPRPEIRAAGRG